MLFMNIKNAGYRIFSSRRICNSKINQNREENRKGKKEKENKGTVTPNRTGIFMRPLPALNNPMGNFVKVEPDSRQES